MTRARKRLFLLYAKNRTVFGTAHFRVMSRFLEEIPKQYLEHKKADYFSRRRQFLEWPGLPPRPVGRSQYEDDFNQAYSEPRESPRFEAADEYAQESYDDAGGDSSGELRAGARVMHPTFGEGIVRRNLGDDKVIVEFAGRGLKKISLKFTQLKGV
jgi:DNA helicase-2/ATP-dependent DNA helicase PcrA